MKNNLIKLKNKITKQNNKTREQVLTDVTYNLTCKMAQDKNLPLPKIYNEQFAEYYYNYLKQIDANVKTKEQATEQLNADFIKSVQGNVMPLLNKQRCINNAYDVFQDVCASCRLQIKQKYGVDNYYALAKSENKQAKQEYYDFESWVIEAENKFNLFDEKTQQIQNLTPKAVMNKAILIPYLCAGLLSASGCAFFGSIATDTYKEYKEYGYSSDEVYVLFGMLASVLGVVSIAAIGYAVYDDVVYMLKSDEEKFAYDYDVDKLFQDLGFKDRHEAYDYINDYITVLPQSEKQALIESVIENYKLSIAYKQGFNTVQEAIETANTYANNKTITLEDALSIQAEKYSNVQEAIAHKFGLADFKSAVTYLDSHKILEGEYVKGHRWGAGWSVYNYDNVDAKILAKELSDLDNYQAQAITAIKQQSWPQQVTDYGEYNDMMNQMNSVDIIKQLYFDKMLNTENYGYGVDNIANATYESFVDKVGVENANKYACIPTKTSALGDAVTPAQTSNIIDNIDASALLFAGCGITAGATLRCLPGIKAIITNIKSNKLIKKLNKHNKQLEQDNNEIER